MYLIPVNVGFNSLQLCKSLILSTSQWGSRKKQRDLFKHTEIVEKNKEWIQPRQTRNRALCAEPALLVPQSQSTCWTVHAERKSWEETSHKNLLLRQKQDFFPWLSPLTAGCLLQWFHQGSGLLQMLLNTKELPEPTQFSVAFSYKQYLCF